jgi:hypothetical protein
VQHAASIDLDHRVESRGVRLSHTSESSFGQFNHPTIMDSEIQARVEEKVVDRWGRKTRRPWPLRS